MYNSENVDTEALETQKAPPSVKYLSRRGKEPSQLEFKELYSIEHLKAYVDGSLSKSKQKELELMLDSEEFCFENLVIDGLKMFKEYEGEEALESLIEDGVKMREIGKQLEDLKIERGSESLKVKEEKVLTIDFFERGKDQIVTILLEIKDLLSHQKNDVEKRRKIGTRFISSTSNGIFNSKLRQKQMRNSQKVIKSAIIISSCSSGTFIL